MEEEIFDEKLTHRKQQDQLQKPTVGAAVALGEGTVAAAGAPATAGVPLAAPRVSFHSRLSPRPKTSRSRTPEPLEPRSPPHSASWAPPGDRKFAQRIFAEKTAAALEAFVQFSHLSGHSPQFPHSSC